MKLLEIDNGIFITEDHIESIHIVKENDDNRMCRFRMVSGDVITVGVAHNAFEYFIATRKDNMRSFVKNGDKK